MLPQLLKFLVLILMAIGFAWISVLTFKHPERIWERLLAPMFEKFAPSNKIKKFAAISIGLILACESLWITVTAAIILLNRWPLPIKKQTTHDTSTGSWKIGILSGALFIAFVWAIIKILKTGWYYFGDKKVSRNEQPMLFWLIITMFIVFSIPVGLVFLIFLLASIL